MPEKIQISILGGLNEKETKASIETSLGKISKQLKLDIDTSGLKKVGENVGSNFSKINTEIKETNTQLKNISQTWTVIDGKQKDLISERYKYNSGLADTVTELKKIDAENGEILSHTKTIVNEEQKLVNAMAKGREQAELRRKASNRTQELAQSKAINANMEKEYQTMLKNEASLKKMGQEADLFAIKAKEWRNIEPVKALKEDLIQMQANTKQAEALRQQRDKGSISIKEYQSKISSLNSTQENLRQKTKIANTELQAQGKWLLKTSDSLKLAIRSFSTYFSVTTLVFSAIRGFKEMVSTIKDVDSALLEANKTMNLTISQTKELTEEAFELGQEIARTGTEVISATASFGRMGFTMKESLDLAEQALILTNVADGIEDVETSASVLISTLKGFGLQVTEVERINDVINELGNRFASSSGDIAFGFQRVSAVMAQSNTSLEETGALLLASNEILQDMAKSSTGLRTISQRLRSVSEEGESLGQVFTAKLQKSFKEIADVDIMDETGLRSTYDILFDLSEVYGTLSGEQQQYLGELVAGKRQIQTFNAIMSNSETLHNAVGVALNSQGSALEENAKVVDSIEGKVRIFQSTLQKLYTSTISSETIKSFVDFGTLIIKALDNVGLLNTGFILLTGFLATKYLPTMVAATGATNALTLSIVGANTAMLALTGAGIAIGIIGVVKAIDSLVVSNDELVDSFVESNSELQNSISNIDALLAKYEELSNAEDLSIEQQLELISVKSELSSAYGVTASELENENNLTKLALRLKQEEIKILKEEMSSKYEEAKSRIANAEAIIAERKASLESGFTEGGFGGIEVSEKTRKAYLENIQHNEEIIDRLNTTIDTYENYEDLINGITDVLDDNTSSQEANNQSKVSAIQVQKEYNNTIDDFQSNISDATSLYDDLVDKEQLSANTLLDLIQKYPEYALQIANVNKDKEIGFELSKMLFELEKQSALANIEAQEIEIRNSMAINKLLAGELDLKRAIGEITASELGILSEYEEQARLLDALRVSKTIINGLEIENFVAIDRQTRALEKQEEAREKQVELLKEQKEVQKEIHEEIIDNYEGEIDSLEKRQLANEEFHNSIIDNYQAEIDALEGQLDLIKEQREEEENLLKIEEARLKLIDAQSQRNTWTFEDGSWKLTADPRAVASAEEELTDVLEEQNRAIENKIIQDQIDALQNKIDSEQELIDAFDRNINSQIDVFQEKIDNEKYLIEQLEKSIDAQIKALERKQDITINNNVSSISNSDAKDDATAIVEGGKANASTSESTSGKTTSGATESEVGHLPSPSDAQAQANRTGKSVLASNGKIYSPTVVDKGSSKQMGDMVVGSFAKGTNSAPEGFSFVHEEEMLINLPKGTGVATADETRSLREVGRLGINGLTKIVTEKINNTPKNGDTIYKFDNITVKADDIDEFLSSVELLVPKTT